MESQRELFFKNPKLLGLGRQIGVKCFEAFGVFLGGPTISLSTILGIVLFKAVLDPTSSLMMSPLFRF